MCKIAAFKPKCSLHIQLFVGGNNTEGTWESSFHGTISQVFCLIKKFFCLHAHYYVVCTKLGHMHSIKNFSFASCEIIGPYILMRQK